MMPLPPCLVQTHAVVAVNRGVAQPGRALPSGGRKAAQTTCF